MQRKAKKADLFSSVRGGAKLRSMGRLAGFAAVPLRALNGRRRDDFIQMLSGLLESASRGKRVGSAFRRELKMAAKRMPALRALVEEALKDGALSSGEKAGILRAARGRR